MLQILAQCIVASDVGLDFSMTVFHVEDPSRWLFDCHRGC